MPNKKFIFIYIFAALISCGIFGVAGKSYGATINAVSPSLANVQSAINSASSGDTVAVPTGAATWSSELLITKAIALQGAGIGKTVITSGIKDAYNTNVIAYAPSVAEIAKTFEMSGFTFDGNYTSGIFSSASPSSNAAITGLKIHGNRFINGYSRAISLSGLEFGVFYSNQFENNYITISIIGSEMNGWNYPVMQGGASYPFFEDNTFNQTIPRGGFISETGRGGRIVFRHNTITNYGGGGGEVWDAHGVNGVYPVDTGTVSSEFYGNTIILSASTRVLNQRGGMAIVFDNLITGSPGGIDMTEYQGWSYCTVQNYPKYQQINKSYYWNNTSSGTDLVPSLLCTSGNCTSCLPAQYDSTYIQLNRDYWLSEKPGYVPYAYPHPLRNEIGVDSAPAAPTGLIVN